MGNLDLDLEAAKDNLDKIVKWMENGEKVYRKSEYKKTADQFKYVLVLLHELEKTMGIVALVITSYQQLEAQNNSTIAQLNSTITADNTQITSLQGQITTLQANSLDAADLAAIQSAQNDPNIQGILSGLQGSASAATTGTSTPTP